MKMVKEKGTVQATIALGPNGHNNEPHGVLEHTIYEACVHCCANV